jgi:hypothetical protein
MNFDAIIFLFNDYVGGADDDILIEKFRKFNLDDVVVRKKFIETDLKTRFFEVFDETQKKSLLISLEEFRVGNFDVSMEISRQLFPFEFPKNVRDFFDEIHVALLQGNAE